MPLKSTVAILSTLGIAATKLNCEAAPVFDELPNSTALTATCAKVALVRMVPLAGVAGLLATA